MWLPKTTLTELACPKCGAAMVLTRQNPDVPQFRTPAVTLWVCSSDTKHPRVIPGFEPKGV